jgi:hypothetical protein
VVDEPFLVFNLKTNGHCVRIIDDTGNLFSKVAATSVEWNAFDFVSVSVKKADEVGHDFLSFSISTSYRLDLSLSTGGQMFLFLLLKPNVTMLPTARAHFKVGNIHHNLNSTAF